MAMRDNKSIQDLPWHGTSMTQVVDHLLDEHTKHSDPKETPPYFSPELEKIMSRHLHLDGTVNEHIANVRESSRWYSPHKTQEALGAQCGEFAAFIQEHMTWIHPRETRTENLDRKGLQKIVEAVGASKRTRVAGLFEVGEATLAELIRESDGNVRACTIATFPEGTLPTKHPVTKSLSVEMESRMNSKTLRLILIEKGELNPINTEAIRRELQGLIPGTIVTIPWRQTSKNFTTSCPRTSYTVHPTLAFIHPVQAMIPPSMNKSTLETHTRTAAALGILPPDLDRQLRYHKHDLGSEGLMSWKRNEVSRILRDTAITVYDEYIKWIKKDKYGVP